MFSFLPVFLAVFLPSSITGDQGERNDEDIQFVGYLLFERDIRCRDTTLDGRGWWNGVRRKKDGKGEEGI